jgi:methylated-DNA-[protein]-cysteine S-methyltransferase
MSQIYQTRVDSPVGTIYLAGDEEGLMELTFPSGRHEGNGGIEDAGPFREVIRQVRAYFARELREFDLPLKLEGTPFQMTVWQALREIPYGETISYGELARRIGRPKASRAVGAANRQNPIAIIVPCHRVIGNDGKLTGYGGGLKNKEKLLALEDALGSSRFNLHQ